VWAQYRFVKTTLLIKEEGQEQDHFHYLFSAEISRQLQESLDLLPTECLRIFHLLYIEGESVKEVATELNLALSTVKTQKSRGLAVLKKRFAALSIALLFYCSFIKVLLFN